MTKLIDQLSQVDQWTGPDRQSRNSSKFDKENIYIKKGARARNRETPVLAGPPVQSDTHSDWRPPSIASKKAIRSETIKSHRTGSDESIRSTPSNPSLSDLTQQQREVYEERAAIMQFDGGLLQHEAEAAALKIAIQPPPAPQPFTDAVTDTDVPQWPVWDKTGAKPCRRCGGPIIFGEITSDEYGDITTMQREPRRKWWIMDPDLMPHACGKRITEPTATEGASAA